MAFSSHTPHKPDVNSGYRVEGRQIVPAPNPAWYEKLYHPPATSLHGKKCAVQPRVGEVAYLEAGKRTKGCDYKEFKHPDRENGERLDIPVLYPKAKAQSVYIEEGQIEPKKKGEQYYNGSGAIVGKRGKNELLILTDNHVVGGDQKGAVLKDLTVRTADGSVNDGKVVDRLPKEDLALVSVHINPKMMSKFEVATAIKSLDSVHKRDPVLMLGFPLDSGYLYASPGKVKRIGPIAPNGECDEKNCYGQDWMRPVIFTRIQGQSGNSGGGAWNANGKLIGVLDGGRDHFIHEAYLNPVTQSKIDSMIRRAKRSEKP